MEQVHQQDLQRRQGGARTRVAGRASHRSPPAVDIGAPHGMRVLCPWTCGAPRCGSSRDHSLPLGYYLVLRGWRIPALLDVLSKGERQSRSGRPV